MMEGRASSKAGKWQRQRTRVQNECGMCSRSYSLSDPKLDQSGWIRNFLAGRMEVGYCHAVSGGCMFVSPSVHLSVSVFYDWPKFEFQYNLSGAKYVGEEPETGVDFYYYDSIRDKWQ